MPLVDQLVRIDCTFSSNDFFPRLECTQAEGFSKSSSCWLLLQHIHLFFGTAPFDAAPEMSHFLFLLALFLCLRNRLSPEAHAVSCAVRTPTGVLSMYRSKSTLDCGDKHHTRAPVPMLLTTTKALRRKARPSSRCQLLRSAERSRRFLSRELSGDHSSPDCLLLCVPRPPFCFPGLSSKIPFFLTVRSTAGLLPARRYDSKPCSASRSVPYAPPSGSFQVSLPRDYPLSSTVNPRLPVMSSLSTPPAAHAFLPLFSVLPHAQAGGVEGGGRLSVTQENVHPANSDSLPASASTPSSFHASPDIAPPFPSSPPFSGPSPSSLPSFKPHSASPFTSPSSPLPTPATPLPPPDLTSGLSPAGRPLHVDPHGLLGQLQELLREGVFKAGAYLQHWSADEERDMDMLVTKIDESAAIVSSPVKRRHQVSMRNRQDSDRLQELAPASRAERAQEFATSCSRCCRCGPVSLLFLWFSVSPVNVHAAGFLFPAVQRSCRTASCVDCKRQGSGESPALHNNIASAVEKDASMTSCSCSLFSYGACGFTTEPLRSEGCNFIAHGCS